MPYVAMVLTEVFTGGPEICLRVKEEQVERVFHLISEGGGGSSDLLHTLQSMVKVSGRGSVYQASNMAFSTGG